MPYIEAADKRVLGAFGAELVDMKGSSCCPEPYAVLALGRESWLGLAARNLSIAEEMKQNIVTPCPGCYHTLRAASRSLRKDPLQQERVNKLLSKVGRQLKGDVEVEHTLTVLCNKIGLEKIESSVRQKLSGLKVAVHYGCHLLKPSAVTGVDDTERPTFLDRLVEATGAESVQYVRKTLCCGGPISSVDENASYAMAREKLLKIKQARADCLLVACPACMIQYDTNQPAIEKAFGEVYDVPVIYHTELLSLAMGIPLAEIGFRHQVKVDAILRRVNL
jgi:heterodisulfide reductase subunit B